MFLTTEATCQPPKFLLCEKPYFTILYCLLFPVFSRHGPLPPKSHQTHLFANSVEKNILQSSANPNVLRSGNPERPCELMAKGPSTGSWVKPWRASRPSSTQVWVPWQYSLVPYACAVVICWLHRQRLPHEMLSPRDTRAILVSVSTGLSSHGDNHLCFYGYASVHTLLGDVPHIAPHFLQFGFPSYSYVLLVVL